MVWSEVVEGSKYGCDCVAETSKFNYVPGTTYEFGYVADIESAMVGTSAEKSKLQLQATAAIHAVSSCDMTLQVRCN